MKKIYFLGSSLIWAVAFYFTSCQFPNAKSILKIGVIGAETGDCSADGKLQRRGIQMAVDEINSLALLNKGEKIDLKFSDSKSEAITATNIINEYIFVDRRNIFIGDVASGLTKAMIPVINQNKVFLFSPWAGASSLKNCSEYFARNYPSGTCEAKYAANYIVKNINKSQIAIVYVNNEWGINLENDFREQIEALKGNVVFDESCSEKDVDFKTLILKLKNTNPKVIYLAGYQEDMGFLVKQIKEQNITIPIIANTSFLNKSCLDIAGTYSEGVIVPTPEYDPLHSNIKTMKEFQSKFKSYFPNEEPTYLEANSYDAIMLIKDAYNKVGNDPIKIANYVRNLKNFNGASGTYSFIDGEVDVNIVLEKIVNGKPTKMF